MLSGWLRCNFCTAYAQPNGGRTYTVLNQLTLVWVRLFQQLIHSSNWMDHGGHIFSMHISLVAISELQPQIIALILCYSLPCLAICLSWTTTAHGCFLSFVCQNMPQRWDNSEGFSPWKEPLNWTLACVLGDGVFLGKHLQQLNKLDRFEVHYLLHNPVVFFPKKLEVLIWFYFLKRHRFTYSKGVHSYRYFLQPMRTPNSLPSAHAYSPILLLTTHAYMQLV